MMSEFWVVKKKKRNGLIASGELLLKIKLLLLNLVMKSTPSGNTVS